MKDDTPTEHSDAQAFDTGNTVFLSDVIARIKVELNGSQRRDTLSAFNALKKHAGVCFASTPASAVTVRPILANLNANTLGISPKRIANIRSLVSQAVVRFGMQRRWITKDIKLSPEWQELMGSAPKREYRWSLSRLACYCSVKGISPNAVCVQTLLGLHTALDADCSVTKPRNILKTTISVWNMCVKAVPVWPQEKLSSPFKVEAFMFPLEDFPQSFQDDVAAWIKRNTDVDPLDLTGPVRPLRPVTLDGYVLTFRRLGSALVRNEMLAMSDITDLSVLANVEYLKAALRHFLNTVESDNTDYAHKMAFQMAAVAKHHLELPNDVLTQIKVITGRLASSNGTMMGKRNRTRLLQFDDPAAVQRLLHFPEREYARATKLNSTKKRAKGVERALIVSLLIFTGLRSKTLRKLDMSRNIRRVDGRVILELDAVDMKTHAEHVVELPKDTIILLEDYIANHRPFLPNPDEPYLFAGEKGGPRSYSAILDASKNAILKHTGLKVSPHLFRHIIAKLVAETRPDLLVDVSRRLAHKSFKTTYQSYLGTETPAASRRINELLETAKNGSVKDKGND